MRRDLIDLVFLVFFGWVALYCGYLVGAAIDMVWR